MKALDNGRGELLANAHSIGGRDRLVAFPQRALDALQLADKIACDFGMAEGASGLRFMRFVKAEAHMRPMLSAA